MKTVGILAEYNPFHNGHQFHIGETKRRTGADYIIAVISGSFVQRGAPALLNKYDRARMALLHGADLVFELPVYAALRSAEGFAEGGIALLKGLGVVDIVSCGCEAGPAHPDRAGNDDTDVLFGNIVSLLAEEPAEYKQALASRLKRGMSYPQAREAAVRACLPPCAKDSCRDEDIRRLLSEPNNILALEYARAIRSTGSTAELLLIPRAGVSHQDSVLPEGDGIFASAGAIRRALLTPQGGALRDEGADRTLHRVLPSDICEELILARGRHLLLSEDDFSDLLFYALTKNGARLDRFGPKNADLAYRTAHLTEQFSTWTRFASLLKTKNRTYTSVARFLTHILLGLTREDFAIAAAFRCAPYARLLGLRTKAAPLMKSIQSHADLPIITHPAQDRSALADPLRSLFDLDLQASEIYRRILCSRSGCEIRPELRQPLVVLP